MTSPLDDETHALLAHVVLTAQRRIPQLSVTITPQCPQPWTTDRCCNRIWIDAHQTGDNIVAALREALADLHAHQQVRTFIPEQRRGERIGVP